jgi:hypothetical protein
VTDTYTYSVFQACEFTTSPLLSIKVVLPTRNGFERAFVDALLATFDSIIAANLAGKSPGIFSLHYWPASDAYLSMQSFGPEPLDNGLVCNIEIGCLHNVDALGNRIYGDENMVGFKDGALCEGASETHMIAFEQLVKQWGARLHCGQMSFTNSHTPRFYPNYQKWRLHDPASDLGVQYQHPLVRSCRQPSPRRRDRCPRRRRAGCGNHAADSPLPPIA